jgi:hypothetical protein
VDAGDGLRVSGNEFGLAAFLENCVHAVDGDGFKWIGGGGIAHSVMHRDEVADIGEDERDEQNEGNFIRDGKNAVHEDMRRLRNAKRVRRNSGVGDGVRTHDPRCHRPMFYR